MIKKTTSLGFTLIELMITIVIIGILAGIAYPSYLDSVRKARRAAVQANMLEFSNFAERIFSQHNSYLNATVANSGINNTDYQLNLINGAQVQTFTIQAVPQGDQANDPCGTLSLNNIGVTAPAANCWP